MKKPKSKKVKRRDEEICAVIEIGIGQDGEFVLKGGTVTNDKGREVMKSFVKVLKPANK